MPALAFAPADADARPLHAVPAETVEDWVETLDPAHRAFAKASGFRGKSGQVVLLPGADGEPVAAAAGLGTARQRRRGRFLLAAARAKLPEGVWRLEPGLDAAELTEAGLGWLLAGYRYARYAKASPPKADLAAPAGIDAARLEAIAAGEALTRDLINTPASDMGPDELEKAARALAKDHGAHLTAIRGDALVDENFPMIHTVGRASPREPRLIDMTWGETGPALTLVGKGVCFDTGGLNLKPGASMGLMKKDMGGAATVLGLAGMIMATKMPIRLRVLIPAVENAVSGNAFRPGDILTSRKGLTVEVNNTDAEGRLVLADALSLASDEAPDLIVSMATLTGAARVAVGADLAPYFTDDDALAAALATAAADVRDPVWRLPFWDPYDALIEPGIADLDNAPAGGLAGAITAALFLRRFVGETDRYCHFDIYGWNPAAAPGRPKGGVGMGARALFEALPELLGL
ncbi:MAG: leucyl aminopeptidase family protein [Paracoccaceae bacterium]|nr:leucyl aminopeptidase family protein [Paracoccaceae bacterium]